MAVGWTIKEAKIGSLDVALAILPPPRPLKELTRSLTVENAFQTVRKSCETKEKDGPGVGVRGSAAMEGARRRGENDHQLPPTDCYDPAARTFLRHG